MHVYMENAKIAQILFFSKNFSDILVTPKISKEIKTLSCAYFYLSTDCFAFLWLYHITSKPAEKLGLVF